MALSINQLVTWSLLIPLLNVNPSCSLRILGLFPLHGKSHFIMCQSLMRNLALRGHQVDVYSHFPQKTPIPNYKDFSLQGSMGDLSNNMSYGAFNGVTNALGIKNVMEWFGEPICELMNLPVFQKLLNDPPKDPKYDVIVVELFAAGCYLAWGHKLQAPVVTIVTTTVYDWLNEPFGIPSNPAVEPNIFSTFSSRMTFPQRLYNVIIGFYSKTMFNYYLDKQDATVERFFGPGYPKIHDLQRDVALVLDNYHYCINGPRASVPLIQHVPGMHIDESDAQLPQRVKSFLDESVAGCIYFTFGSMMRIETFPRPILEAFYTAFREIAPVRVLMKIAKPEELPPDLPTNVLTQSWLPQRKILQHKNVKAFVTHGGMLGMQESIYSDIPMIGIPLFGDQYFNIESGAQKNISIRLDLGNITGSTFTAAVKEILNNSIYKRSVERVGSIFRDSPIKSIDKATFWVEYVARHGKDSLKSPIVHMRWWQRDLIDVYGFIALAALVLLFLIHFIIKTLIGVLFSAHNSSSESKLKSN